MWVLPSFPASCLRVPLSLYSSHTDLLRSSEGRSFPPFFLLTSYLPSMLRLQVGVGPAFCFCASHFPNARFTTACSCSSWSTVNISFEWMSEWLYFAYQVDRTFLLEKEVKAAFQLEWMALFPASSVPGNNYLSSSFCSLRNDRWLVCLSLQGYRALWNGPLPSDFFPSPGIKPTCNRPFSKHKCDCLACLLWVAGGS